MDIQKQISTIKSGTVELIGERELEAALVRAGREKRPLRVKYGADPSAPDLHLGHTVPLRKLRQLQDLGHIVVFIIGDFTARIGDPSGQSATRKMLTQEEIKRNAETYQAQVFRLLERRRTEVRYNSEWLEKFKPDDFLNLASKYTVARLLERDDFQNRYQARQPIALVEFLYPLLQGYDSVVVKADVEVGGTDQKFNLLVGRELQREWKMTPQAVLMLPLLEGTDGRQKMSKSLANQIGLNDPPKEMYGKLMSIPDALMEKYFRTVAPLPAQETEKILEGLKSGTLHPRKAKARLAWQIVKFYHSEKEADEAGQGFDRVFKEKEAPEEIETVTLPEKEIDLLSLLKETKLAASGMEARRLIAQGGVKIDSEKITDERHRVRLDPPVLVQYGKRKFLRVRGKQA